MSDRNSDMFYDNFYDISKSYGTSDYFVISHTFLTGGLVIAGCGAWVRFVLHIPTEASFEFIVLGIVLMILSIPLLKFDHDFKNRYNKFCAWSKFVVRHGKRYKAHAIGIDERKQIVELEFTTKDGRVIREKTAKLSNALIQYLEEYTKFTVRYLEDIESFDLEKELNKEKKLFTSEEIEGLFKNSDYSKCVIVDFSTEY